MPGREWSEEFECTGRGNGGNGCGALLLISYSDLYATESHARCETTRYITILCPQCGKETDLYEGEPVPLPWKPSEITLARRKQVEEAQRRIRQKGVYTSPLEIKV